MSNEYEEKTITTFLEVFNEIAYDWESHYGMTKLSDNEYVVNKLYISKDSMQYKTNNWPLAPGVFDKVVKLYKLLYPENSLDFIENSLEENEEI